MSKESYHKSPSRRRFLRNAVSLVPLAAVASTLSLNSPLMAQPTVNSVTNQYIPQFFNHDEWRFIIAATDRLIPQDQYGAGAVAEGVPVFIDKQMELPYGYGHLWYMQAPFHRGVAQLGYQSHLVPRETYRRGIKAINAYCLQQNQQIFADLTDTQQEDILRQLESGSLSFEQVAGDIFFTQLLENTKEGYLADPVHGGNQSLASWRLIGFPGARADYQQVMDQPNKHYPLGPVSISGKRS